MGCVLFVSAFTQTSPVAAVRGCNPSSGWVLKAAAHCQLSEKSLSNDFVKAASALQESALFPVMSPRRR